VQLRGTGGRLTRGGRAVALLAEWDAEGDPARGLTLHAKFSAVDAFWLTAPGPLRLTLTIGARPRIWAATLLEADSTRGLIETQGAPL
jgi:hypothetical protein